MLFREIIVVCENHMKNTLRAECGVKQVVHIVTTGLQTVKQHFVKTYVE
jgi:hypothetical protein